MNFVLRILTFGDLCLFSQFTVHILDPCKRLIGPGKAGLLYVQGISDIEDKIKEKRHKLRRNSFGVKSSQSREEQRNEIEKMREKLRNEILELEKYGNINF